MPSYLTQVFQTIGNRESRQVSRHLPMINSLVSSYSNYLSTRGQIAKKKNLMGWYKRIPELTALCNKVARDSVYKYHFESVNPTDVNKNKIMKANKFALEVGLRRIMFSQYIDMLITGEGFGWMGKLTDKQVKEVISKSLKKEIFLEKKEKDNISKQIFNEMKANEGLANTNNIDEDLLRPRKYRNVPSTTMEIIYDQYDILNYNHIVGIEKPVIFSTKEIIRFSLMQVDGKPNGFTPVESILVQLELLRQMWQNQLSIHKNGGRPDAFFILKDMRFGTPDYKAIEQQLQKYKIVENAHGNLLFTGDIDIKELARFETMEFKDMGLYITGLMAMQWGIPKSSIPYIVGGQVKSSDTGGDAERSYWRNIDYNQQIFAEIYNTQLWIPHFGVKLVFDSPFPQNDVTRQTARNMQLTNLELENQLFASNDKQLANHTLMKELGRMEMDLTKKKEDPLMANPLNNQIPRNQPSDSQSNRNAAKRIEQTSTIQSRGMKPTGIGKEWDKDVELEYKQMRGMESMEVSYKMFIKLYGEDKMYHPGKPPRIFMRRGDESTTLIYKSDDFVYKTQLSNSEIDQHRILLLNLEASNIYLL